MALTDDERNALVAYRLEKARETMLQVRGVLPLRYWEIIANRLYYAAFYAVSALLISEGIETRGHNGVIQMFGLHFIKPGRVPQDDGKLYSRLFSLRLKGDYSDNYNLVEEDVIPMVEPTDQLIQRIAVMLQ